MMVAFEQDDRSQLRQFLMDRFVLDELVEMAYDIIGPDYESLPSRDKRKFCIALITYLEQRGRLRDLVGRVRGLRPDNDLAALSAKLAPGITPIEVNAAQHADGQSVDLFERLPKVLLVDDTPRWRDAVTRLLQKENCHLVSVGNFEQARDLLSQGHFDVVITNLVLEEGSLVMEGLQVLDHVKALGGSTQCIVLATIENPRVPAVIHNKYRSIIFAIVLKSDPWVDYDSFLQEFRGAVLQARSSQERVAQPSP
jgi:CheY-like chemotaxis protein